MTTQVWAVVLGFFRQPTKQVLYPVLMLPSIGLKKLITMWQSRHATA